MRQKLSQYFGKIDWNGVFIDLRLNGLALVFVVPVGFVVFPDPELDAGRLKVLMLTIALKEVAVQSIFNQARLRLKAL